MKAIILAAGFGSRMMPFTRETHKTLLESGGRPVLARILDALQQQDVDDILIVTGYRADELKCFVDDEYPDNRIAWVHNEHFDTTNNITSLALAFEQIDHEDTIIIESDLVFESDVIKRLLDSPHPDIALVSPYILGMDGTVVSVDNSVITQFIPPHLQTDKFDFSDKYKTLNIYKFSAEFCETVFRPIITFYAQSIDKDCYYESILGIIIYMRRAKVYAEIIDNVAWTEIDDPMDLNVSEFQFNPVERTKILQESHGGYWKYPFIDFCYIRNMHFPTGTMLSDMRNNLNALLYNYGSSQKLLDQKLAHFVDCEPEQIVLLNGASQVYPILKKHMGDEEVLRAEPSFGEYTRIFPDARHYKDSIGVDIATIRAELKNASVVVIVNPNNPTGTTIASDEIMNLAGENPDVRFIVDESFIDFSDQTPVQILLRKQPLDNILVIKSLSKVFGVPGLRLGYVFSTNLALMALIRDEIPIWNINSLAEYYLEILFKRRPELAASFEKTKQDRDGFASSLRSLDGVHEVFESGGNFLLTRMDPSCYPADRVVADLLADYSIYVKCVSERFDTGDTYLRFAVRTEEDNENLVETLRGLDYK